LVALGEDVKGSQLDDFVVGINGGARLRRSLGKAGGKDAGEE